jgi:hypothetical protein
MTLVVKLPLASALDAPATWFVTSQYRLVDSLGRKAEPFTVMMVFGGPAVTSMEMKALTGIGDGVGVGEGVGGGGVHGALAGQ